MKEDFPTFEGINTFTAKHAAQHTGGVNTHQRAVTDGVRRQRTRNPNSDQLMSGGETRKSPAVGFVRRCFNLSQGVDTNRTSMFEICTYWDYLIHGFCSHNGQKARKVFELVLKMSLLFLWLFVFFLFPLALQILSHTPTLDILQKASISFLLWETNNVHKTQCWDSLQRGIILWLTT